MKKITFSKIIGSTGVFNDGDWVESKDQDPNGEVRLIQLADIGDGIFIDKSNRFLTSEKAKQLKCTYLKEGDVLVARMPDPLGRACIFPKLDKPCVTVVDVCIIRPDSKIAYNAYVKFLINSPDFRNKINRFASGTTRQRISRKNLDKISFSLPDYDTQLHIANILSKVESLIAQRKESIRLLDEYLKSMFLEMFGDSEQSIMFKLNDLKAGGNESFSNGPFGSDLLTSELTDSGIPVVYIRDLRDGKFNWISNVFVTWEKANQLNKCQVEEGDILIAKVGMPPGISAVYRNENKLAIITQDVIRLRTNNKLVLPSFLSFFINSDLGQNLIKKITISGTRSRFSLGDFKKLTIPVPPTELQIQFSQIVEKTEALKAQYQQSLQELANLYGSLNQKAFKGELSIKEESLLMAAGPETKYGDI